MRHQNTTTENLDHPEDNNDILSTNLPDELKISLYQEAKRNENRERKIKKDTPILVKNIREEPSTNEVNEIGEPASISYEFNPHQQRVAAYLNSIGVKNNEKNELVLAGTEYPGTNYETMVHELTDARKRRSDASGVVMSYLKKLPTLPKGVFSFGMMRAIRMWTVTPENNQSPAKKITPRRNLFDNWSTL